MALLALVLALLLLAGGTPPPAAAQQGANGTIALTSEVPWVTTSATPLRIGLAIRSTVPAAGLSVSVALYAEPDGGPIASRSEFDVTLGGDVEGLFQVGLSSFSLQSVERVGGSLAFYVSGAGLPKKVPRNVPLSNVFPLTCPNGCDGVYPLQVSLLDTASGQAISSLTTYLIVAPTARVGDPLRFSFVVPLGTAPATSPGGIPALSRGETSAIDVVASELSAAPSAPLTLDAYGQALRALSLLAASSTGARGSRAISPLRAIAAPGAAQLITPPFADVDPTILAHEGLAGEIGAQIAAGRSAMKASLHTAGTPGMFVATRPLDSKGLAAIASSGITKVVVPEQSLQISSLPAPATVPASGSGSGSGSVTQGAPGTAPIDAVGWPYPITAPFYVGQSRVEAVQADAGLAAHLAPTGDPALSAQQLLADLAMLYFQSPTFGPRGVVLVAPSSWTPDVALLSPLLAALSTSPIISTVPLPTLFATVPAGRCALPPSPSDSDYGCSPSTRALAGLVRPPSGALTASEIATARSALASLASVVQPADPRLGQVSDAILLAETAGLDGQAASGFLASPTSALHAIAAKLTVEAGRTITVTATTARIPVSVNSASPSPVHVTMVVSSPNLSFPGTSRSYPLTLLSGTNNAVVSVTDRTSGDSALTLQLESPVGGVVLASGQLTIRSTAISGVAIALTAGAALFLLIWWGRSVLRRGKRRSGAHARKRALALPAGQPVEAGGR